MQQETPYMVSWLWKLLFASRMLQIWYNAQGINHFLTLKTLNILSILQNAPFLFKNVNNDGTNGLMNELQQNQTANIDSTADVDDQPGAFDEIDAGIADAEFNQSLAILQEVYNRVISIWQLS